MPSWLWKKNIFQALCTHEGCAGIPGNAPFCRTENPWTYTAAQINSPREGSLLSVKQLRGILELLGQHQAKQTFYKLILPFSFPHKKFEALCTGLEKSGLTGSALPL